VQVLVDGKPQQNWPAVFKALGLDFGHHIPYSTINGVVVSANDHIDQLLFPNTAEFDLFTAQAKRIRFKLCYCSSLGECWAFDDAATFPGASHTLVAECPARGDDQFLDNVNAEPAPPDHQEKKP